MESHNQELFDKFHELEKECIGYDNFVNNDDEHYKKTLDGLRKIVSEIQKQSLFSPNETIKEVQTEHLKLLMAPYYQAVVLGRIMEDRMERVKMSQVFFIEYLRMLDHYEVLEKDQIKTLEKIRNTHKVKVIQERTDASIEELKEAQKLWSDIQAQKPNPYEDREAKVAEFKMKKAIEQAMDTLKNYHDDETKRDWYMA